MLSFRKAAPFLLFTFGFSAVAQTYPPGQYPPSTYPPNQYPNQYPYPSTYPPGTARLPGGIGLPVPEIKIPKRGEKDKDDKNKKNSKEVKITLKSINGTLRKMGEKDLLLETSDKGILRFRLLAKTLFRDKAGEPVRDSLLKPGDQLQIEVNPDDEETAFRVVLLRAGTAAERASASQPVDTGSVRTPEGLEPEQPELKKKEASATEEQEAPPRIQRRPDGVPQKASGSEASPRPDGLYVGKTATGDESLLFNKGDDVIEEARDAAANFSDTLPNFLVQQHTTRFMSTTRPPQWQALDIVTAEVACVGGKEEYRDISINGRRSSRAPEKTGAWSTGEWLSTLQDVLSNATNAAFVKRGEDRIANRTTLVYDFTVKQPNSHWRIIGERSSYTPGYKGAVWIDKQTHRVLRIEQKTLELPGDFEYEKAEGILEYDFVRIEKDVHLLPVRSENLICGRGNTVCSRNEIYFRNYRQFNAESNIQFERKLISDNSR